MQHNQTEKSALLEVADAPQVKLPATRMSSAGMLMDPAMMDKAMNLARIMASGRSTVPKHLQGNVGDCMAVVMQSMQWGLNPFTVAQKTHLVNGTLGYEGQLVNAIINNSGVTKDRINFEWFGPWEKIVGKFKLIESKKHEDEHGRPKKFMVPDWDGNDERGLGIRVWATIKGESQPRVLELLLVQARVRNSTLWAEDPKQQLAYLAERRWGRLHVPDVMLGVYVPDELEQIVPIDMGPAEVVSDWPADVLQQATEAANKGTKDYGTFWKALTPDLRDKLVKTDEHQRFKEAAVAADAKRTVDAQPAAATSTASPASSGTPPEKTFDEIMAMICEAKNIDALFVAGDWINTITDPDQAALLNGKFDEIKGKLEGGAA